LRDYVNIGQMNLSMVTFRAEELQNLSLVKKDSHKGQNGKVLVIGGSTLFHSASIWAAELLAHFVDLVFYYSPALLNRKILKESKKMFRNGIVINIQELEDYLKEADVILVGPGMKRKNNLTIKLDYHQYFNKVVEIEKIKDEGNLSYVLTNVLLAKYANKKFVLDAGALQELEIENINMDHILTPHQKEFLKLFPQRQFKLENEAELIKAIKKTLKISPATYLLKIQGTDFVFSKKSQEKVWKISNGNEGLVKGGTGDLLAALVTAFYVKNPAQLAAASASYILKSAADRLYQEQGPYYTTTQLLRQIPKTAWKLIS